MEEKNVDAGRKQSVSLLHSIKRPCLCRILVFCFLLMAIVPLLLVGGISYRQARNSLWEAAFETLRTSATLKSAYIEHWFEDRFIDLKAQTASKNNKHFLEELRQAYRASGKEIGDFIGDPQWRELIDEHAADLITFKETYEYYDVFLIDQDGAVLYTATEEDDLGTNLFNGLYSYTLFAQACRRSLKSGLPTFSDLEFYPPSGDIPAGFIISPITDDGGGEDRSFCASDINREHRLDHAGSNRSE